MLAVLLGGSRATGTADSDSDTDLYALHSGALPRTEERAAAFARLADGGAVREETAWGLEDHMHVDGQLLEVVYLDMGSVSDEVERAYTDGLADEEFAGAFLRTVVAGRVLQDPERQLAAL